MKPKALLAGVVGLAVGAALLAGCSAAQTPVAGAQTQDPTGITVVGEGRVMAAPDVAYISLGVETTGATAKEAMDANAQRMNEVVAKIKSLGVQDREIQTSGINLFPVYDQKRVDMPTPMQVPTAPDAAPRIIGYRAGNSVRVAIYDLARAPEVLDGVVSVGANSVSGLQFGIKDDSKLRQQALSDAAKQTRDKAQVIADALGVRIVSIASVREEFYGGPMPVEQARAAAMDAAGSTPVSPGELTVMARVTVTYNHQ
jgi:uncharacterized protein YggE